MLALQSFPLCGTLAVIAHHSLPCKRWCLPFNLHHCRVRRWSSRTDARPTVSGISNTGGESVRSLMDVREASPLISVEWQRRCCQSYFGMTWHWDYVMHLFQLQTNSDQFYFSLIEPLLARNQEYLVYWDCNAPESFLDNCVITLPRSIIFQMWWVDNYVPGITLEECRADGAGWVSSEHSMRVCRWN